MKTYPNKACLLIIFIACSLVARSQSDSLEIDSLKKVLLTEKEDTNKVNTILELSYMYSNPDTAIIYAQKSLQLSKQIKYSTGEAESLRLMGINYLQKSNFVKALEYFQNALSIYKENNDDHGVISVLNNYALIASTQNDLRKALDLYFKAETLSAKIKDSGTQAVILANMSEIYKQLGKLDSAEMYLKNAEAISIKSNDVWIIAFTQLKLGGVYLEKKMYGKANNYLHESLNFYLKNDANFWLPKLYIDLAKLHMQNNGIDSAFYYAYKSYDVAKKAFDTLSVMKETAMVLSQLYEQKNNYEKAFYFFKLSTKAKDSSLNQETSKKLLSLEYQEKEKEQAAITEKKEFQNKLLLYIALGVLLIILITVLLLYHNNRKQKDANIKIEKAYLALKSTQAQLIQSEKMASLGELTAGIAHEIQNPLNFVNNFSEVNNELIDELEVERRKTEGERDENSENQIISDIKQNNKKINHHGKRADAIVKGMLQHSRQTTGIKEPTDINALADEYLRLSYHGLRAKDKSFNADFTTDFDAHIGKINIIPQDIGRVLLNLFNNAFYAVNEKKKTGNEDYKPLISVQTGKVNDKVEIIVSDNGNGIPQNIIDKIFQPFFTTKPTGEGTGLGLSLAYDIITKMHGGDAKVDSKEGEGTKFVIILPL